MNGLIAVGCSNVIEVVDDWWYFLDDLVCNCWLFANVVNMRIWYDGELRNGPCMIKNGFSGVGFSLTDLPTFKRRDCSGGVWLCFSTHAKGVIDHLRFGFFGK